MEFCSAALKFCAEPWGSEICVLPRCAEFCEAELRIPPWLVEFCGVRLCVSFCCVEFCEVGLCAEFCPPETASIVCGEELCAAEACSFVWAVELCVVEATLLCEFKFASPACEPKFFASALCFSEKEFAAPRASAAEFIAPPHLNLAPALNLNTISSSSLADRSLALS